MKINPVIKVSRVATPEEALEFEALGADIISVALRPEHGGTLFDDDRAVSAQHAENVGAALSRARLALALADPLGEDPGPIIDLARRCSSAYVEAPAFDLPGGGVRAALASAGIGLVVSRIAADHDDDPGWLLSPITEASDRNIAFVEIELLADHERAWQFMTEEAPAFPDDLQLADIDSLARDAPLLISADATPDNAATILATLPHCGGMVLTVGKLAAGRHDAHVHTPEQAAAIIRAIRDPAA